MKKNDYADEMQLELYKKFPNGHYLNNSKNLFNTLAWITFFRRNFHRFVIDYLGIPLYEYQALILYLLGIGIVVDIIGSRSISKSFIIALGSICRAVLYPYSKIVIPSATLNQAELVISEKIQGELMPASERLREEIKEVKRIRGRLTVIFWNGSRIQSSGISDTDRGLRSTFLVREENRMIPKKSNDEILSPFQISRFAPYIKKAPYSEMPELKEEPVDAYISSSWLDNGHWMWKLADDTFEEMLQGKNKYLLAFDESVILKHGIKTKTYLLSERKKLDELSWRIEYLNERVKENTSAFFTYSELSKQQRLLRPFYPRRLVDVLANKKNPYEIPKQTGEIRILACDMAFIQNRINDNSIFSCMRLLPESTTHITENKEIEMNNGYRRQVPYIESVQGGDIDKQALRIRQLFEDFKADYLVLDLRNAGIAIYDRLAKIMYDEERKIEYTPLCCMNDEEIANRIKTPNADPCIFVINASQKLNSIIATNFKTTLQGNKIDLLISYNKAIDEYLSKCDEYLQAVDINDQLFYEKPFLETQEFINETNNLVYERKEQTGLIVISERGKNRKDRWTSISYADYFASQLEKDLISSETEYLVNVFVN